MAHHAEGLRYRLGETSMKATSCNSIPASEEYRSPVKLATMAILKPARETYCLVLRLTEGAILEVR